jgi:hypothetical protein
MNRFIYIIVFMQIIMLGCRKEKPAPSEPLPSLPYYLWTDFIGTYDVYDTLNNTQWVMKISHLSHSEFNQGNNDSVLIENFANRFTIRDTWYPAYDFDLKKSIFSIKIYHPLKDYSGHNWHLGGGANSILKKDYVLYNDSVTLYFKQSNIAFYQADGVPYYDCDCKHIAVKRH